MRKLAWSFLIGFGLTLSGFGLWSVLPSGSPDSMGGTTAGHIAGVLVRYHHWTWASIFPLGSLDRWMHSFHGPMRTLVFLAFSLGIPTVDWACLVFVTWWVTVKFSAWRYARTHRPGVCTKCGYDLRGLPEPRCPECGTPFDPKRLRSSEPPVDS